MKNRWLFLACAGFTQLSAGAQTNSSITNPVLGYFLSSSHGLVAVEGISTAAMTRVYPRVAFAAERSVLPPGQAYIWIERSGAAYVEATATGHLIAVAGAVVPADLQSFTSDGSTAVLYSKASGKIQVITGLPSAPSVTRELAAPAADSISAIAISDDAGTLLAAGNSNVYASSSDSWRVVMPRQASAIAFIPRQTSALVAIKETSQVYSVKNPGGTAAAQLLAGPGQGIDAPIAVAGSDDGRLAIVMNSNRTQAVTVDLNSLQSNTLQLGIIASEMQRGRDSTFLFLPRSGASPWLLDTKSGHAVLSFAPELPGASPIESRPVVGRR